MSNRRLPPEFAEYGNVGIQMVLIIGVFVVLGRWLDGKYTTEKPWFTLALSVLGVIVTIVFMIKKFSKISSKNNDKDKK